MGDSCTDDVLIDATLCDPANTTRCKDLCGIHGTSFLLEEGKCCAHVGKIGSILAFEEDESWVPRIREFNKCTGAKISLEYLPEGEDGMSDAVYRDVENAGTFDAYIVQGPMIPRVVSGLKDLAPLISCDAAYVNWLDINAASRDAVSYNGTVKALPLDCDYIAIGWNEEVFKKHGIPLNHPKP